MLENPTQAQFAAYLKSFDYYNKVLFNDNLPSCLLNFSRKNKNVMGFYSPKRWESGEQKADEISLNPDLLKRPLQEVMGTLVHEMCHLWQCSYGQPSRSGYHNWEFAEKMEEVGLITSNTGEPGGKRVGQRMTHYVTDGGPFDVAFGFMPDSCKLPWVSGGQVAAKQAPKVESKIKYTCPGCGQNAWGKPGLLILCAGCIEESGAPKLMTT